MSNRRIILPTLVLSAVLATALGHMALRPASLPARSTGAPHSGPQAVVSFFSGGVQIRSGSGPWQPARRGQVLHSGTQIRTAPGGRAEITFADRPGRVRLAGATRLSLVDEPGMEGVVVASGSAWAQVAPDRGSRPFVLSAPDLEALASTATYRLHVVHADSARLVVYHGKAGVAAGPSGERLSIAAGQSLSLSDGFRVSTGLIDPEDDWQDGWIGSAEAEAGSDRGGLAERRHGARALRRELTDISPEVYLSVQLELKGRESSEEGFRAAEVQIRRIRIRANHWDGMAPERKVRLLNETFSVLKDRYPNILHSVVLEFDDGRPDLALKYGETAAG